MFKDVKFHSLHRDSKISQNVMGFISCKYDTGNGYIGFNSIALLINKEDKISISFPTNQHFGFDYFFITGKAKEELTKLAFEEFDKWEKGCEATGEWDRPDSKVWEKENE